MNTITASQVMSPNVLTVGADWAIPELLEFLTNHAITGAPVIDGEGRLVGVVSYTDVARSGGFVEQASAQEAHVFYRHGLEQHVAQEEMSRFRVEVADALTVGDIMTPMVFAVQSNAAVQDVAEMMITGRIHRVLVKQDDKMVGIISALDLLPLVRDMR